MASMALINGALPKVAKFGHLGSCIPRTFPWGLRSFVTAAPRPLHVIDKTKDVAGKVVGAAQELGEKAKQTVQDAWGSAKETTQKVKETVVGKAEDTKESIKEGADAVKRTMNTNN